MINFIAKAIPRFLLKKIGALLFKIVMVYLFLYTLFTKEKRERLIEYKWILKRMNKGSLCLDVGCGDSLLGYILVSHFPLYLSIDIKIYPIIAINPEINFIKADITHAPFKSNLFNTIICISTLEHINNYVTAIYEMSRILKNRGKLHISVPSDILPCTDEELIQILQNYKMTVIENIKVHLSKNRELYMISLRKNDK